MVARFDNTVAAVAALRELDGVGEVHESEPGVVQADLEGVPAADAVRSLVAAGGVSVSSVAPRNRLQDVVTARGRLRRTGPPPRRTDRHPLR